MKDRKESCKSMKLENINIFFGTGVSSAKNYEDLYRLCEENLKNGIIAFDTAPSYQTEGILGVALNELRSVLSVSRENIFVQSKIDPIQLIDPQISTIAHIHKTLLEMKLDYLDSLLIHWPLPEYTLRTLEELSKAKESGLVRYIGICNVRQRHIEQYEQNIKLDIVQIERNPLNTCDEIISCCKERDISVQAYSPLCKMNSELRNSSLLNELCQKYHKDIGEIILQWHYQTDVVPIFTSKKLERVKSYSKVKSFLLDETDIQRITSLNKNYKMYLESWSCPGF